MFQLSKKWFGSAVFSMFSVSMAGHVYALEDFMYEEIPQVISSSQMYQSHRESPASVAVIEGDQIERHGFTTIQDSVILFPGMMIANVNPTTTLVGYKGESISRSFRIGLMVDNISPMLRTVSSRISILDPELSWHLLPVIMEEVERIEGVMSPSASVYGSDAFQATINVLSKTPALTQGQTAKISRLSQGKTRYYFRHGGQVGDTFYRVSYENERYDTPQSPEITDPTFSDLTLMAQPLLRPNDQVFDKQKLLFNASLALSEKLSLDLKTGFVSLENPLYSLPQKFVTDEGRIVFGKFIQFDSLDESENAYFNTTAKWDFSEAHDLELVALYNRVKRDFEPVQCASESLISQSAIHTFENYLVGQPSDEWFSILIDNLSDPIASSYLELLSNPNVVSHCGFADGNLIQDQLGVAVKDIWTYSDSLRTVTTLNIDRMRYDSERLYGGEISFNDIELYSNVEYKPTERWTFNLGGQISYLSHQDINTDPSYRMAVNYQVDSNNTLRIAGSKSKWLPKLENFIDYRPILNLIEPFEGRTNVNVAYVYEVENELEPEINHNIEIGYYGNFPQYRQTLDVRVYKETQKNLIPGLTNIVLGFAENRGRVEQLGTEVQYKQWLSESLHASAAVFYVDSEIEDYFEEEPFSSYGGTAMIEWHMSPTLSLAMAYHGSHGNDTRSSLDQSSINLRKSFSFHNGGIVNLSLGATHMGGVTFQQKTGSNGFAGGNVENSGYFGSVEYSF